MYFLLMLTVNLAIWHGQVFGGVILRDAEESEVCETEDCIYTANHILKWLNPEVDPCDDFYEFACGNWRKLPLDQRTDMSLGSRESLAKTYIPGLIKDPSKANGNKHFEKLIDFMNTCMDEDTIQKLGVSPIKQLIQKSGGWPVLDADWSDEDWDFLNAEITLGGVLIYVGTTNHQPENSTTMTHLLDVGSTSLIRRYTPSYKELVEGLKNKSTKAYYETLVDVAVALGADKEVAKKAMLEVLEFETALTGELKKMWGNVSTKIVTLKELQETVPWLDFAQLFQVYLPDTYELLPDESIDATVAYFAILDKFINQYPSETFVNYMISKAVYPLLKYVHHGLTISPDMEPYEYKNEKDTRFDYCVERVTDGSMGPAMAAYLGILYSDDSKVAEDMTKVIIEELAKVVEEYDWFDEVTRGEAAKNVSEIKIDVGFPSKIMDLEKLDKLYEGHEMDTSNLFDAVMYDKRWTKRKDMERLHKNMTPGDDEYLGWKYYAVKGLYLSAKFNPRQNSIIVSGSFLYFTPLFGTGRPAYVNYGHVGTVVAHELIHAVDSNAAPDEFFLEMERWGSNKTESTYNQKKQCFIDFYSSINDTETTQMMLNGEFTQREDMADNGGIKLSLRAYRKFADQLGSPEQKLPRLQHYTIEQLFMISAANTLCEIPDREKRMDQIAYDPHSPLEFRLKGMMMNSPDFGKIFNCDKKDPMNPQDKCEVW